VLPPLEAFAMNACIREPSKFVIRSKKRGRHENLVGLFNCLSANRARGLAAYYDSHVDSFAERQKIGSLT